MGKEMHSDVYGSILLIAKEKNREKGVTKVACSRTWAFEWNETSLGSVVKVSLKHITSACAQSFLGM